MEFSRRKRGFIKNESLRVLIDLFAFLTSIWGFPDASEVRAKVGEFCSGDIYFFMVS